MPEYSKDNQLSRSPGGNTYCSATGELKRNCSCNRCRGRRNRNKGKRKQLAARKAMGITVPTAAVGGNEENWRGNVRVEVKSGQQVKAMTTRFLAAESQAEEARAIGDNRRFVFVAMPDNMTDGIVAFRLSQLYEILEAMAR